MKWRVGLTIWIYACSLLALVLSAVHLHDTIELYSPLDAGHAGPVAPLMTQQLVLTAVRLPYYLGGAALLSLAAALGFWRSRLSTETKTFAVTLVAAMGYAVVATLPWWFFTVYFVIPKAANTL